MAALLLVVALGLLLTGLSWWAQRRLLAEPARKAAPTAAAVSILKPLRGVDPDLEANLESFFRLEGPPHELIFAVQDREDPAVAVVRRLLARHPAVAAQLVIDARSVGINPKVNNLANALRAASHDVLLISDSNVRVEPGYLDDMVARLQPGVGLVSSLIRGGGGSGLGGALEALQLNTFVMRGVATWSGLFGKPCVVGKSMLLRRTDLEALGGFEHLGRYLAEDQVCGEEIAARGLAVVVSGRPVDNRLGRLGLLDFCRRHLRWARLRSRLCPPGYVAEILLAPNAVALAGAAALRSEASVVTLVASLLITSALAMSSERRLGIVRPAWCYPPLELLRSTLVLLLWPVPFLSSQVSWRGRSYRIGSRSLLLPLSAPLPDAASGEPMEALS